MLPQLPTVWDLYNLRGSPYFQGGSRLSGSTARSLELFVGRTTELMHLRSKIQATEGSSSQQAVAGATGVGKTTLVQELKARLFEDGFLTSDERVQILANDTPESVFGRVLATVYRTILVNRPAAHDDAPMIAAQLLARVSVLGTVGPNVSRLGGGVSRSEDRTAPNPRDIRIDGPRIMRDLMKLVRASNARGVILHFTLENLNESNSHRAAGVLRSLHDLVLTHDGVHTIVVGTNDVVASALNQDAVVRSTFETLTVESMAPASMHQMLAKRYRYFRLRDDHASVAPITADGAAALYTMYRGDLRGLLKALDDGVRPLIGLAGYDTTRAARASASNPPASSRLVVAPLALADVGSGLHRCYAARLEALPERARVRQLVTWGTTGPDSIQTQASLTKLWRISQSAVSSALAYLVSQGYVVILRRTAGRTLEYALSGTSRIVFG